MEISTLMRKLVCMATLAAGSALAQTRPAFEVASIKPATGGSGGGPAAFRGGAIQATPGNLVMRGVRFSAAVRWAYSLQDYQVSGPAWINEDRYDIVAKADGPAPENELRLMAQTLLIERFKLAFHRQTKEMQALAFTVAKGGHKLKESATEGPPSMKPNGRMGVSAERATVAEMATMLSQPLRMPILDQTELTGKYDFTIDMTPYITDEMMKRGAASGPPDILGIAMAAAHEQLGLKLEARKLPVEMLIIDHAEKTPTEN